jgi:hypothetical protein
MHEVSAYMVPETEERTCADWSILNAVCTPRGQHMLVVQWGSSTNEGAALPPLQRMARAAEGALEDGGRDHKLECGQISTFADFCSVFQEEIPSTGD